MVYDAARCIMFHQIPDTDTNAIIQQKIHSNTQNLYRYPKFILIPWHLLNAYNTAPPATSHRLLNQKWPTGSGNTSNLRLLDPLINFR